MTIAPELYQSLTPSGTLVADWMDRSAAPYVIPSNETTSATVVLCDEIDLSGRQYASDSRVIYPENEAPNAFFLSTCPPNVVLIADTLRLRDAVLFKLRKPLAEVPIEVTDGRLHFGKSKSGGNLTVFTRRLMIDDKGWLGIALDGDQGRGYEEYADLVEEVNVPPEGAVRVGVNWIRVIGPGSGGDAGSFTLYFDECLINGATVDQESLPGKVRDLTPDREQESDSFPREISSQLPPPEPDALFTVAMRGGSGGQGFDPVEMALPEHPELRMLYQLMGQGGLRGKDGALKLAQKPEDPGGLAIAPHLVLWRLKMFERLHGRILDAERRKDRTEIIRLFRRYESLPGWAAPNEQAEAYTKLLSQLNDMRDDLVPSLGQRRVEVAAEGLPPRPVDLLVEGSSLENRMAPTEALLVERRAGGRKVVGMLEFDPAKPSEVVLTVDAKLTIDPFLAQQVRKELSKTGESLAGAFTNWKLVANTEALSSLGLRDLKARLVGGTLRCSLTLDADQANFALWQLASSAGLPLEFNWTYPADPDLQTEPVVIPLTLARRETTGLTLEGDQVSNVSRQAVTISYVAVGEAEFVPLTPALTIAAGKSAKLPLPAGTDVAAVRVPPEAVTVAVDPQALDADLFISQGASLIERVTVRNLLPAFVDSRQQALDHVEVTLTLVMGEGAEAVEAEAGPCSLAAANAQGDEVTLPFVKPRRGISKFRLAGTVFYQGGGKDTLKTKVFDKLTVNVDESLLP